VNGLPTIVLPGAPVPDGRTIRPVGRDAQAPTIIMPVNNPLERIIREIRRRTRVVGAFPDGHSALMLAAARLRHIASTKWGKRRYMLMDLLLNPAKQEAAA
jgi:transposase-like protein